MKTFPSPVRDGNWQVVDGELVDADAAGAIRPSPLAGDAASGEPSQTEDADSAPDTDEDKTPNRRRRSRASASQE